MNYTPKTPRPPVICNEGGEAQKKFGDAMRVIVAVKKVKKKRG